MANWQQNWGQQPGGPNNNFGGYQQPGGGGFYPMQPGGFYPHQHHHHHHHGGYIPHHQQQQQWNQQGGFVPQHHHHQQQFQQFQAPQPQANRGGFSAGASEFVPGGWQPRAAQQQQQPAPQWEAPKEAEPPKPTASDLAKLSLAGPVNNAPIPKKTGKAKTISLGGPKKVEPSAAEAAESAPAPAKESDAASKPESPTAPVAPSSAAESKEESGAGGAAAAAAAAAESAAAAGGAPKPKPKPKGKANKLRQKEYIRDPRPHFSVVFCGHVDSGKSTCSGHLLADFGLVDEREMDRLRKEAESNHREGWEYAYILDISEEEKAKGKTHETGAAYLETEHRRVTILDAPGHNAFVGSMIGGAAQADIAVLIISAKTGEFESGFNKGGQTREHVMLCRACGVRHMIVAINKMDDLGWDQERYDKIVAEVGPFLKANGFNIAEGGANKNATVMPISGLSGIGLVKQIPEETCAWYRGPSLIEYINKLQLPATKTDDDELCVPLVGAYKDENGKTFVYGKIEAGNVVVGDELRLVPGDKLFVVEGIQVETTELEKAYCNDNVHLRVRGIDESEVHTGYVATTPDSSLRAVEYVEAKIVMLESTVKNNLFTAGSKAVMHVHTSAEEIAVHSIRAQLDRKTMQPIKKDPPFIRPNEAMLARLEFSRPIVVDEQAKFDKLGRFVLRQGSTTVAVGLIVKLYSSTKADVEKKEGGSAADGAALAPHKSAGAAPAAQSKAAAAAASSGEKKDGAAN